ncbi:uncharacterized protein NPIL_454941 [Nephila pilipes]|uniref:Gustatory receptor n=1 Tax=Nephila pilipes TaxID=299642 RepID=A0A8X6QMZ9_NEPPI|nr:uncharacterized protein NPIL_454941 [Nephila pilipes]
MLSANTFAIYYATICCHLKLVVAHITESLTGQDHDCNILFRKYIVIRKLVLHIDDELSFLVFISSVFNACGMYFSLTAALHPSEYLNELNVVTVCSAFAANAVAYIGIFLSASLVPEAVDDLWSRLHEVLSSKNNITNIQQRTLSILEKGLYFTVWKFLPIKRSYILATMGTIFTYSLLLDSLGYNENLTPIWNS